MSGSSGARRQLRFVGLHASFGSPFTVHASEPLASELFDSLADLRVDRPVGARCALTVEFVDGEWVVSWDGRARYRGSSEDAALHGALGAINVHAARVASEAGCTVLHGGAVDVGGAAVAFVGHSRAGKSTFTAAMVLAGYGYLADEVVAVDDDRAVQPFHRPIGVRAGAAELLGIDVPGGPYESIHPYRVGEAHQLGVGTELALIVVLRRSGSGPLRLQPISPSQALYELCTQTLGSTGLERLMFGRIDRLVRRTPAVELYYTDATTSVSAVVDRVARYGVSDGEPLR